MVLVHSQLHKAESLRSCNTTECVHRIKTHLKVLYYHKFSTTTHRDMDILFWKGYSSVLQRETECAMRMWRDEQHVCYWQMNEKKNVTAFQWVASPCSPFLPFQPLPSLSLWHVYLFPTRTEWVCVHCWGAKWETLLLQLHSICNYTPQGTY